MQLCSSVIPFFIDGGGRHCENLECDDGSRYGRKARKEDIVVFNLCRNKKKSSGRLNGERYVRGMSLLEVLVAMTVLAIGLLGMAALLGKAMQYNHGAQARTQAVLLASDMVERVRTNRPNRIQYTVFAGDPRVCDPEWMPAADSTVAQNDVSEWLNNIGCRLPGGVGEVQVDGNTLSVAVGWTDTSGANAVDTATDAQEWFVMRFQL